MKHVFGIYEAIKTCGGTVDSLDISTKYYWDNTKYILDSSVDRPLTNGVYLFSITNESEEDGKKIRMITPLRFLRNYYPCSSLWNYWYSRFHDLVDRIILIKENNDDMDTDDKQLINYTMRVMVSYKISWVPEAHTDETRSYFVDKIYDMIISGELNPCKFFSNHRRFNSDLPIRRKYDTLIPSFIPSGYNISANFHSSDIGYRSKVKISSADDVKKYKRYFHPDLEVEAMEANIGGAKFMTGIRVGYKLPEKGSPEYDKMIRSAELSDQTIGRVESILQATITVPSTHYPNTYHPLTVGFDFYPEVFLDILSLYKLYGVETSDNKIIVACDDDYKILDFDKLSFDKDDFSVNYNKYILIQFENGLSGRFRAKELLNLRGKCTNATIEPRVGKKKVTQIIFHRTGN